MKCALRISPESLLRFHECCAFESEPIEGTGSNDDMFALGLYKTLPRTVFA